MINKSFWKNKKILITGHTGFKGRWLCVLLEMLGSDVYGISLKNSKKLKINHEIDFLKKNKSFYFDLKDKRLTKKVFKKIKPDIIFHFAAQSKVLDGYKNTYETFETNFITTLNVLSISKEIKNLKTILLTTTDKVYENNEKKTYFKENDKLGGDDPYSASKSSCEILINSFRKNYKVKLISARAGNVIGGGDWVENRILPDIIKAHLNRKKLKIRNPKSIRPWQYIVDIIYGYVKLVEYSFKDEKHNLKTINVGFFQSKMSVLKLLKLVRRHIRVDYTIKNDTKKLEKNYLYLDLNLCKRILKIKKFKKIESVIPRTVELYKKISGLKKINEIRLLFKKELNSYLNEKIKNDSKHK